MLTLDYTNCLSGRVGAHGVDEDSLAPGGAHADRARRFAESLAASRGSGWERWRLLPFSPLREALAEPTLALADHLKGRFENMLVLGIGGSALGVIAVQSALNSSLWNLLAADQRSGPRMFVLDNADPVVVTDTMTWCADNGGLARTLVVVVSKSGETAETAAQFLIARRALVDALGETGHAQNVVAITDAKKGTLRSWCDRDDYATLPVPDGVGGRFSVLSPVGLFPLAMCGVDVSALLDGGAAMDARCARRSLAENPGALLATLLVELGTKHDKPNHVLMPYANSLYLLADWYRQLWAESLGKRVDKQGNEVFAGFTPIKALGATDQHSQVQLYREGPNDKVIGFVEVEKHGQTGDIPRGAGVEALEYLEGATLATLLNAEKRATEYALTQSQRPNFTLRMATIDARHVGEFIQLWQMATAYAGLMLNVDAYDQPAVELGKLATFALMGRSGFDEMRQSLDADAKAPRRTV